VLKNNSITTGYIRKREGQQSWGKEGVTRKRREWGSNRARGEAITRKGNVSQKTTANSGKRNRERESNTKAEYGGTGGSRTVATEYGERKVEEKKR